jgi:transcriptional regulator with XRE-family HTH domain
MRLSEIGQRIKLQRLALGLTQEQLARLAELSHTTMADLEAGTLGDLAYAKVAEVLGVLGLDLQVGQADGLGRAVEVAAQNASTSFRSQLSPEMLATILVSGRVPEEYQPHLMVLLDETPLPLVVQAIRVSSQCTPGATVSSIMQHMSHWADELMTNRRVW